MTPNVPFPRTVVVGAALVLCSVSMACEGFKAQDLVATPTVAAPIAATETTEPTRTSSTGLPVQTATTPQPTPMPMPAVCGRGRTPEVAIGECDLGVEYYGDCQLEGRREQFDGGPPAFSCSLWISSRGDVRLYRLASIEPRFVVLESDGGGGWLASRAGCEVGESGWLCRPEPFDDVDAILCGQFDSDFDGTVSFRVSSVRVLASRGTIEVEMTFRGSGLTPVPWTTDVGRTDIYLTDDAGITYPSSAVGGHLALDLPPLDGLERSGWHEFHVEDPYRVFKLMYGRHGPFTLDLTTARPCPESSG